jgi:hypothetical protein
MRFFEINSPTHIRLLSESDAVAYHYCSQRMKQSPRDGRERLLVYDFGAGTLDLSVISLEWNRDPFYPRKWAVESRLGVPVAGNHLDEILGRIVDEMLRDPQIMQGPGFAFTYPFPVVAEAPANGGFSPKYRETVLRLHRDLKEAKHQWDGSAPFTVRVGGLKGAWGVVRSDSANLLPETLSCPALPGLFADGDFVMLSIPARVIHDHPRVVEFIDFGGCDILHHASREMAVSIDRARYTAPAIVDRMVEEGRLGLKSGSGFYEYEGRDVGAYRRDVLSRTLGMLKHAGLWQPPAQETRE